jgi:hypothetical protein
VLDEVVVESGCEHREFVGHGGPYHDDLAKPTG